MGEPAKAMGISGGQELNPRTRLWEHRFLVCKGAGSELTPPTAVSPVDRQRGFKNLHSHLCSSSGTAWLTSLCTSAISETAWPVTPPGLSPYKALQMVCLAQTGNPLG